MCAAKKAMDHDLRISMYVRGSTDGCAQSKHARRGCRVRVEGTWSTGAVLRWRGGRRQPWFELVARSLAAPGDGGGQ